MSASRNLFTLSFLTLVVVASGGCEIIAAVDRDKIPTGEGGAGTGGIDPTGGGGSGGCSTADDCPVPATDCIEATCMGNVCGQQNLMSGASCATDGGTVCDGNGACVECLDDNQCTGTDVCDVPNNTCVPAPCLNMMQDGTETDVDCGGDDCAPCANNLGCLDFDDCESGFCDDGAGGGGGGAGGAGGAAAGSTCAPCGDDFDCQGTDYCDANSACVGKLVNGDACNGPGECQSDECVDGLCCDTACTGGCEACDLTGTEGTCSPHPDNTDPENACTAITGDACNGAGACECTDGMMNGNETATDCGGGTCNACGANQACNGPSDCISGVCTNNVCSAPTCGDGVVQAGEGCDDGNQNNSDACPDDPNNGGTCQPAACGDGFVQSGVEQCDDGNSTNTDACPDDTANGGTCQNAACGDGFVQSGVEQCDDGNSTNTDACPDDTANGGTCQNAACGDGFVQSGVEQCDDGNSTNTDACPDDTANGGTCQNAACGDGFVQSGVEQCDDGNSTNTDACPDDTANGGTCQNAACGDGFVQSGVEQCDDGNSTNTDACPDDTANGGTCQNAACGDGFVQSGVEQCDDGNSTNTDACPDDTANGGTCQNAACGDGFVQSGVEQCDDGNSTNTDACPDDTANGGTCQNAACGDGFVQSGVEQCDDGNSTNTDACPDDTANGGTCQNAACGDGFVQSGVEQCDDGNSTNTDACPDDTANGGTCQNAACGDGFVQSGVEQCDDGNTNNNDACPDDTGNGGTCQNAICGDGFIFNQGGGSETCDDANTNNNDDCPDDTANGGTCQTASCSDGFLHDQGTGTETNVDCGGLICAACPDGLLLSELVVTPTTGEFIELHNPTGSPISLGRVHLADFNTYYEVAQGTASTGAADFFVKLPDAATIPAGGYVTVAVDATGFNTEYGGAPDYDLAGLAGSVGGSAGLTNGDEMVVAFYWDGTSDLVQDIDYIVWGNTSDAVDKTGIMGGASTYLGDTAVGSQVVFSSPGTGSSASRCDLTEGTETTTGGNGFSGADETSENIDVTWSVPTTVTPGTANACSGSFTSQSNWGDARALATAVDAGGNLIVAGSFTEATLNLLGTSLTNAGFEDIFVAKIDNTGSLIWAVSFGGAGSEQANEVVVDSLGNVIVTGRFSSATLDFTGGMGTALTMAGNFDVFAAKLSGADGSHVWSVGAGGAGYESGEGLDVDGSDDVYVAGFYESATLGFGVSTLTNQGSGDAFVAKLSTVDGSESALSGSSLNSAAAEQYFEVAVDATNGRVFAAGHENGSGDFDILVERFDTATLTSDATANAAAVGDDFTYAVDVDASGNVAVGGTFNAASITFGTVTFTAVSPSADAFVALFDGTLAATGSWVPTAASDESRVEGLWFDGTSVVAGGYYAGAGFDAGGGALPTPAGLYGPLLVKLTGAGAHEWSTTATATGGADAINDVSGDGTVVWAVGEFESGTFNFGGSGDELTNLGGADAFAASFYR